MFGLRLGRKKVKNRNAVLRGLRLYMQLLLLGGAFTAATTARADLPARAALPVPCSNSCSANGWITSGQASLSSSGSTLYVNQQSDKAILNWQSFNIGADSKVQFNQPATTSVVLNRIYQADPSKISGSLNANGQGYLI
ncbi:MAG: filamentous hemagglutinin N-terminal domain-containing protein, partial [Pseudomonadota bacterium]|nr:filamentous hemagglutinin N-terminal domain-containing protein [Pseudomonadota bacterium]